MKRELDISTMIYVPNRKVYGFIILMKNYPGVLAEVSKVLYEYNVNILKLFATSNPEVADGIFFCDLTESNVDLDELKSSLESLDEVIEVKIIKPIIPGLVIDNLHFPLLLYKIRCVILIEDILREMVKGMRSEWGSAAEAFLYYLGVRIGRTFYKAHMKNLDFCIAALKSTGIGDFKINIDYEKGMGEVTVKDSIECSIGIKSDKPFSHLIRGVIAGIAMEVIGAEVEVIETRCVAKGDEYCVFQIKKK